VIDLLLAAILPTGILPTGVWEGVVEYPRRPVVVSVDFAAGRAKADAAGAASLAVEDITSAGGRLRFRMALGSDVLWFDGDQGRSEIRGTVTAGAREIPFWLAALPARPHAGDRVEAWQQDLDVMLERFLRYDRSFSAAARAAFRDRLDDLRRSLASRSDPAVMVELARAVALAANAHTRLYLVRNRTEVRRLPIRTWWFKDGLYVVRARPEHRDLLGCRVAKVAGVGVEAAAARVKGIKAGNASWQRYMSAYLLTSREILEGVGLLHGGAGSIPLTLSCRGRSRGVRLAPLPLRRKATPTEAWWDLAPGYLDPDGLVAALSPEKVPRYLRHPEENYWFEYVPELRALYFQYSRSQDIRDGPSVAEFSERLAQAVAAQPLAAFIVDLRFNTGGDLSLATPLVERLAGMLRETPVFVLTGRATFSAGITHAAQWKEASRATVIGEPAGDELDFWAEGGNLVLPNSGLTAHYSTGFHAYSKRQYPENEPYLMDLDVESLAPDVVVEPGWDDYVSGRDPVFDAVARPMSQGRPAAPSSRFCAAY
jgi:hypothetical protein